MLSTLFLKKFYERSKRAMEMELQNFVASVGFPIALSMYLLVRIEGKLQTLTDSINELSKNILTLK
jgi:hypothetical protein